MILLTLSAAIYGMITFGMSNFYLMELNKSLEKELDTTIEQISNMTNEETQKTLERFAIEYGISIVVKNQEGEDFTAFGSYYSDCFYFNCRIFCPLYYKTNSKGK